MSQITENQKYLMVCHNELVNRLTSIFNNENIKVSIEINGMSKDDLTKFADLDDIRKGDAFEGYTATILEGAFYLTT